MEEKSYKYILPDENNQITPEKYDELVKKYGK